MTTILISEALVARKHILVVDDDAMQREIMDAYLSMQDYDVTLAHNGVSGLKRASEFNPDLVILDVKMPDMTGYEVCEILKTDYPDLPILLVTGFNAPEDREQGFAVGANDFMTRPFDGDTLISKVATLLAD